MPKVSVIVPVYNVEAYVEKCLRSVLCQTEKDFELLVVDDGATDDSGKICDRIEKEDDRIRVIHQKNQGLGGARNTGIEEAQGEWILFLDSDDWLEPNAIEVALNTVEKTGAEIGAFAFRSVDETGKTVQIFKENVAYGEALDPKEHREVWFTAPCAWNKLYKAELFTRTGVRYTPRVWYEDIPVTMKLFLAAEGIAFSGEVCHNYLLRQGAITKNTNADRNVEILEAFNDILGYFKEQGKFEEYRDELCYLTVFHAYITASVRVVKIDRQHPLLGEFARYINEQFPQYKGNKYLPLLGKNKRLTLALLDRKMYLILALLFKIKG